MAQDANKRGAKTTAETHHMGRTLERAGIILSKEELEGLAPLYEKYLEQLEVLHAADLDDEEVAGVFTPSWPPEPGATS